MLFEVQIFVQKVIILVFIYAKPKMKIAESVEE